MGFNEKVVEIKNYLKSNLNNDNTEFVTKLDKFVDEMAEEHKQTATKLSDTQEKLIEIVKTTSFKVEGNPNDTPGDNQENKVLDIDSAFDKAFQDIEAGRRK